MSLSAEERFALGMANPLRASVMYPPSRELLSRYRVDMVDAALANAGKRIGLYVHVPFCERRCSYCDYATLPLSDFAGRLDEYVDAVVSQLEAVARSLPNVEVAGLDIGGGTPAVLSQRHFERILDSVRRLYRLSPSFEASTETTPALASEREKWKAIADAGLGRVSMGIQSADGRILRRVGRANEIRDAARAGIDSLRASGIDLLNVDLMFALPGESVDGWQSSVELAVSLEPDVITTYDTVYKNRSIAFDAARDGQLPGPETFGRLYDTGFSRLQEAGFSARYGSVNFSRVPGRLGTSRYLEGRILDGLDYVGVGLYASSLLGNTWLFAPARLEDWLSDARSGRLAAGDVYALPVEHVMAKYLLLALSYGFIDPARFAHRFGEPLHHRFGGALETLRARGLLERIEEGWAMTPGSFAKLPGMRATFYPPEALELLGMPVPSRR